MSMFIGRFAAQVRCVRPPVGLKVRVTEQYNFDRSELQMWSQNSQSITWPLFGALNDQLFQQWHERWNTPK